MATATTVSPITTHVLDTARGKPAPGIEVKLERLSGGNWQDLSKATTNQDGRVPELMAPGTLTEGVYRLTFDTSSYFRELGQQSFYPYVAITFEIKEPSQHYHVPLLLSPFGYSTYRGS